MVEGDARAVLRSLPPESVTCTVTSPPYGNLKDYGPVGQIGFGQDYDAEYLPALGEVLSQLYRVSKPGAALWVVLDTIKESGALTPLPWQVADLAGRAGWTFHDLVIWDKGRTLPWSHRGRFRNVFEYILLLGKGPLAHFDLDSVRDTENLGPYWVRYPERYHPHGKAPSDLWHFPIPVQGSWSKAAIRHSCPFPVGLVARMIALTSKPGDVVLDCFAGTGSVPATAAAMERRGIGVELNPDFVQAFGDKVCDELTLRTRTELQLGGDTKDLSETIIQLRMQKFAKALFSELSRSDRLTTLAREQIRGFVLRASERLEGEWITGQSYSVGRIDLDVLAGKGVDLPRLRSEIQGCIAVRPLSKFGIEANVEVRSHNAWSSYAYIEELPRGQWYLYRRGRFHLFDAAVERRHLYDQLQENAKDSKTKIPALFSRLKLEIPLPSGG